MDKIKDLFASSYYFWIVSRIILIVLLGISLIGTFSMGRMDNLELAVNLTALAVTLMMIHITINEFRKKPVLSWIKSLVGLFLIIFGLTLAVALYTLSEGSRSSAFFLGYPLAIWMFLLGIFEMLNVKRKNPENDHN